MDYLYGADEVGTTLKIVGIARVNEDAVASMMTASIGYTSALTTHVIETTANSDIVKAQLADPATDVLSGLPFPTGDEAAPTLDEMESGVGVGHLDAMTEQTMQGMTRESIVAQMSDSYAAQMGVSRDEVVSYIEKMDDETLFSYVEDMVREQIAAQYAEATRAQLSSMTVDQLAAALDRTPRTEEQTQYLYDNYMPATVSDSTYDDVLAALGYVDLASPSKVSLYAATFADKDAIADCIADYNKTVSDEQEITYTDYVALLMSSITTIINAISYVLIAFVSISLIVSSIMIGIITYISVLERTKEIGILRAIGASKRDISRVFNAETLIEGLIAGLIGIGLTLLLIIPINAIVQHLTGIASLGAVLPPVAAVLLVAISMLLTFIAGLIPSRFAAKKDPVVALRTE